MIDRPVSIIVGHYGSGKSEFSVNFAKKLNREGENVVLSDLDIVNPYFRSREIRQQLEEDGITVVADILGSTQGLDVPWLSPAIRGYLTQKDRRIILDCGGDDVGIRVLKQYTTELMAREVEVLMLVNVFRPETASVPMILAMKEKLEREANLRVTSMVNNSNFIRSTTVEDMIQADVILKEVSEITGIPIKYVSGIPSLLRALPKHIAGERFEIQLLLRSSWL